MPWAPPKPCARPGCGALTTGRLCDRHRAEAAEDRRDQDRRRGSAASRGYGARWRAARAVFLRAHPLCRMCEAEGVVEPATEVDHIRPHRGDHGLFWDPDNWQPLCKRHHASKTAREDGGWGRGRGG